MFKHKLLIARREAKMSQRVLAEKLGLSTNTIISWENGHTSPSLFNLQKIADVLHRPATWFVEEEGK